MLAPTRIYVKALLAALKVKSADGTPGIRGMAHITGGGLTENIPRVLPDDMSVRLDLTRWELPSVFRWLKTLGGIESHDLARTLNCGIGMIVICDSACAGKIKDVLEKAGETVYEIGNTEIRNVADERVILDHIDSSWA